MAIETTTIEKDNINDVMPHEFVFIGYASFEQRSTTVPLSIDVNRISKAVIFRSKGYDNSSTAKLIGEYLDKVTAFVELDLGTPINTARMLTEVVKELITLGTHSLVIDVTTFTHEVLLMLLKLVLNNKERFMSVQCLYNGANNYSVGDSLDQAWLSKGCKDVRNVIGYPGLIRPSSKNCLVLLTGFELERATRLIELIEPDKLVLGTGVEPTSDNHKKLMEHFRKKFDEWKINYKNANSSIFNFSCKDVEKAIKALTSLIAANTEDNYIIVPLNTKLSTIATSIVALQNQKVQVCYAIPEAYNTKNYSTPSEHITVVNLYNKVKNQQY